MVTERNTPPLLGPVPLRQSSCRRWYLSLTNRKGRYIEGSPGIQSEGWTQAPSAAAAPTAPSWFRCRARDGQRPALRSTLSRAESRRWGPLPAVAVVVVGVAAAPVPREELRLAPGPARLLRPRTLERRFRESRFGALERSGRGGR